MHSVFSSSPGVAREVDGNPQITFPEAAAQMQELLERCKEKRDAVETSTREMRALEAQTESLARWVEAQSDPTDTSATRMTFQFQLRLFEQLKSLPKGRISIQDCDAENEKSLARCIQLTFEAYGWDVENSSGLPTKNRGEEITFVVAPGPVDFSTAGVYMALQSAGARLNCQVDLEQPENEALLCVHRISCMPKLLPAPNKISDCAETPLKKSA